MASVATRRLGDSGRSDWVHVQPPAASTRLAYQLGTNDLISTRTPVRESQAVRREPMTLLLIATAIAAGSAHGLAVTPGPGTSSGCGPVLSENE